jgi:hypothetical protein
MTSMTKRLATALALTGAFALIGTGMASSQLRGDQPPGSRYQTLGERQDLGFTGLRGSTHGPRSDRARRRAQETSRYKRTAEDQRHR